MGRKGLPGVWGWGGGLHPPQGATSGGSEEGSSLVQGHTRACGVQVEGLVVSFLVPCGSGSDQTVCSNFIPD